LFSCCAENFFEYALELFANSGHTDAIQAEFINHSAKQFFYLDCGKHVYLSRNQRKIFTRCDNISRLFTFNTVTFFSINLSVPRSDRSQTAHNIHSLIQSVVDDQATICLFRHADKIMFSFAGYNFGCILSDWYSNEDEFFDKLNIANMTIANAEEYFLDFVSLFIREYYFFKSLPKLYETLQLKLFFYRDDFNESFDCNEDYVEYTKPLPKKSADNDEFYLFFQESEIVKTTSSDEQQTESEDELDLSEIDDKVFDDPELLLEYIEKFSDKTNAGS